ncbi:hypothetical protein CEUSTIGMA_g10759.t1 [Chlamydomonas eustigma]|uniref:DNA 3'-5' helicase n=1 Tax=Chlamydomonas eustigma TaxID=1157962 RepID=A0A250XJX3_9CHLO|nr:hypothetical protein CEUSTIGMA_g10759.t1 [Chlamydomonas eustigma]|eukprot:GAX83333.1 hypothetical protein CEUSTIGMA_g10759.t1 [Chlamydomonas eustigma]
MAELLVLGSLIGLLTDAEISSPPMLVPKFFVEKPTVQNCDKPRPPKGSELTGRILGESKTRTGAGSQDDYGKSTIQVYDTAKLKGKTTLAVYKGGISTVVKALIAPFLDVARVTDKKETPIGQTANLKGPAMGPVVSGEARPTIREDTSVEFVGPLSAKVFKMTVYDPNDVAKTTVRETTNSARPANVSGPYKLTLHSPDIARTTIRETQDGQVQCTNLSGPVQGHVYDGVAKTTIREQTSCASQAQNLQGPSRGIAESELFEAKTTIREQTSSASQAQNLHGPSRGVAESELFEAKTTIREQTSQQTFVMNLHGTKSGIVYDAAANVPRTTNREISSTCDVSNLSGPKKLYAFEGEAKTTIRESTCVPVDFNISSASHVGPVGPTDAPRTTNRELDFFDGTFAGSAFANTQTRVGLDDKPSMTLKDMIAETPGKKGAPYKSLDAAYASIEIQAKDTYRQYHTLNERKSAPERAGEDGYKVATYTAPETTRQHTSSEFTGAPGSTKDFRPVSREEYYNAETQCTGKEVLATNGKTFNPVGANAGPDSQLQGCFKSSKALLAADENFANYQQAPNYPITAPPQIGITTMRMPNYNQPPVDHDSGDPLLVLAAAGTGKTQAITCRIANLILVKGVPPEDILAITFTRKAAAEMRNRTALLCNMDEERLHSIGTFHGMCNSILRRNVSNTPLRPGFEILNVKSSKELLDGILEDACAASNINDESWIREFLNARKLDSASSLLQRIDEWRSKSIEPGDPVALVDNLDKVAFHAFQLYRAECLMSNVVDFSDIIALTNGLLESSRFDGYSHVIVDEFQDTNIAQLKLVRLLTGPNTQLVVVGDDYQAIHEWRGATVRNILEFEKTFPNARSISLSQNYRSKPGILELASRLIAHNKQQRHKLLVPTRTSAACMQVLKSDSPEEEAASLVKIALASNDKIAVLYRINAQSCPFEEALRSAGVSFVVRGGRAFFQRPEISAMLAMAGLASKGYVDDRTFEVLFLSSKGLGQKSLEKLKAKLKTNGRTLLSEALEAVGKRLLKFARSLESVSNIPEGTHPKDVIKAIINLMGFQGRENDDESPQANAEALLRISLRFTTMEDFLDYCALATTDENSDAQMTARVELMTIHSSKGLEFPCVFIAGCSEGQFPDFRSVRDGKVEEERRLCYVGITRAKDTLYLSTPSKVWGRPARQSRFLAEMGFPER